MSDTTVITIAHLSAVFMLAVLVCLVIRLMGWTAWLAAALEGRDA